jgi:hypothetical protein
MKLPPIRDITFFFAGFANGQRPSCAVVPWKGFCPRRAGGVVRTLLPRRWQHVAISIRLGASALSVMSRVMPWVARLAIKCM